ncbi:MAG: CpaF/VirB11 family protein [Candidatus Thermoplasmatota archaeon]|nr:CpaF/VirB11 family protein [Candidatus Thermoplasmatota archaeon]
MMFNEIALPVTASLSSKSIHAENTIGSSAPLMGVVNKPGGSIEILLFSLVISLSLAVWYAVYYDSITNVNHGVNRSQYHDYSRLARGVNGMGIYFLLSIIPYFGWIFMFSSEISAARIRRQATRLGGGGFHPSRLYSVMAFFTGIGLLIYSFVYASTGFFHVSNGPNVFVDFWGGILTLGGYSTNSVYVQIWFLAMAAAAFTSIAAGSRHNITIPFMIIFILVLLTSFLNVEYGFFSLIGILFLFSITSRISLRHARYVYLKSGGKTVSTTGSVQAPDSQPQSQPQAQSAQGSSGKTRVIKLSDYENTFVLSGPPSSGKTTFLSYLYKFMPDIEKITGIESTVDPGLELLEEYISKILIEHRFPELTQKDKVGEVVFRFVKRGLMGSKSADFSINDIAGEHFDDFRGTVKEIRDKLKGTRFEYMLMARSYVIMVDCSEYANWGNLDVTYSRFIQKLFESRYGRGSVEIAFIFSKADTLPDAVAGNTGAQLLDYLRDTSKKAKKLSKNLTAFKISVKTERSPEGDIVPKLDILEGGRRDIIFDPIYNKDFTAIVQWISEVSGL